MNNNFAGNKTMGLRIMRGAAIGAFIGMVAGIGIPTALNWKKLVENKEQIALALGNKVIETFSDGALFELDMDAALADGTTIGLGEEAALTDGMTTGSGEETALTDGMKAESDNEMGVQLVDSDCSSLEDVVLRFHVRANSNSDEDIALKLAVRDAVLMEIGEQLQGEYGSNGASNRDEVLVYLEENLDEVEKIAKNVILQNGYDYEINAYISEDYFPIRQYGELTLPAGDYTALRVDIGKAAGENFWCLLYPTMCYTVDSEAFVSKEGEDRLEQELSEEDYDKLFVNKELEKGQLVMKFKLLEWMQKLCI